MGNRLLFGALKGGMIGALVALGLMLGLGWATTPGLLGSLVAMGVGATAGLVSGKPPWRQDMFVESLVRAVAGFAVGALVHVVGSRFLAAPLPFAVLTAAKGTPWAEVPLVFLTPIGLVYGALVELDRGRDDGKPPRVRGLPVNAWDE
jgi:hypothetical protein